MLLTSGKQLAHLLRRRNLLSEQTIRLSPVIRQPASSEPPTAHAVSHHRHTFNGNIGIFKDVRFYHILNSSHFGPPLL